MSIVPPDDIGSTRRTLRRFLAGVLMAVGGIIAGLTGLCSLVFLGGMLVELLTGRGSLGEVVGIVGLVMIVGGVPFATGLALFLLGRNIGRTARKPDAN